MQGNELQLFIVDKLEDTKAQDIMIIDVRGKSSITDVMVICTGTSNRHVMSIADNLSQAARKSGNAPLGVSGEKDAEWIVVDMGDVIVHIMQAESRQLYELEKLWS